MDNTKKHISSGFPIDRFLDNYLKNPQQTPAQARKILIQRFKVSDIYRVLDKYIQKTPDKKLIFLAMRLNRSKYFSLFLSYYGSNPRIIDEFQLISILKENPLSEEEQKILVQYIIDNWQYDIRFLNYLNDSFLNKTLDGIMMRVTVDGLKPKHLQAFSYSQTHISSIQNLINEEINADPEHKKNWIPYLDISILENQELLDKHYTMIEIHYQLRNSACTYFNAQFEKINIVLKLIHRIKLSPKESTELKLYVAEQINSFVDVDSDKSIVLFLQDIAQIDKGFSEALLIALYNKTKLYSNIVFDALLAIESEYAYREMVNRLLNAKSSRSRMRIARQVLSYYPSKYKMVLSYAHGIGDASLIKCIENEEKNLPNNSNLQELYHSNLLQGNNFEIIPANVEVNELLTNLAIEIDASEFYASVGFVFSSGLSLLTPLIQYISSKSGHLEIIAGSLQSINGLSKHTKIDKQTVCHLNRLLSNTCLKLYTFEESFFHGKFYYLSGLSKAYVIIGSTNISKTAFFSNRELDVIFPIDLSAQSNNPFLNWYKEFKKQCTSITYLDEDRFSDLNWDSELSVFNEQFVKTLSKNEILRRIESLDDSITKRRMENWMRHNPTKYLDVHNIPALDNYVMFIYQEHHLAAFESFDLDNAYYVFSCDDYEQLITQISQMTKSQMSTVSQYKSRGYHIQDQERLQENIDFYFR